MGAWIFKRKSRGGMYTYSRPGNATYRDSEGNIKTASPNQVRVNHDEEGNRIGMMFGDGDTMTMPFVDNNVWRQEGFPGVMIIEAEAPPGVEIARCGAQSFYGAGAMKTYVVELTETEVANMENAITFFPNEDNVTEPCHLRLAKYYADAITLPSEYAMMVELNTFMHGVWY